MAKAAKQLLRPNRQLPIKTLLLQVTRFWLVAEDVAPWILDLWRARSPAKRDRSPLKSATRRSSGCRQRRRKSITLETISLFGMCSLNGEYCSGANQRLQLAA